MTNLLKPEVKEAWLAKLRSGDYKQARDRLCSGEAHCCLGVALDVVYPDDKWIKADSFNDDPVFVKVKNKDDNELMATVETALVGGLSKESIKLMAVNTDENTIHWISLKLGTLASMNDKGKTFAEIADYIQENL